MDLNMSRIRKIIDRPARPMEIPPRRTDDYVQFRGKWYLAGSIDPASVAWSKYYPTRSTLYQPLSPTAEADVEQLLRKQRDLEAKLREAEAAVSTSERTHATDLRTIGKTADRIRNHSTTHIVEACALIDRADELLAEGPERASEAMRMLDQAEALWSEGKGVILVLRKHAATSVSEVKKLAASGKNREAGELLPQVGALIDRLQQSTGDKSLSMQLEDLRKELAGALIEAKFETLKEDVQDAISNQDLETAYLTVKSAVDSMPQEGSEKLRSGFRKTMSDAAVKIYQVAKESGNRTIAATSLVLAREVWRENPSVTREIINSFNQANAYATMGRFDNARDEVAYLGPLSDLEDITDGYREELSNASLAHGYSKLKYLNFAGAFRAVDFAREVWEENPNMAYLRMAAGGVIFLGVLLVGGVLLLAYDQWQRRANPTI
jgi:hypothetical protein